MSRINGTAKYCPSFRQAHRINLKFRLKPVAKERLYALHYCSQRNVPKGHFQRMDAAIKTGLGYDRPILLHPVCYRPRS